MAAATAVIALEGVRKVHAAGLPEEVVALDGVSLEVHAGELVAIVGPSGSGKSSLLHLMGALDTPSAGRVCIEGRDLAALSDTERTLLRRERIGFVFQFFNLLPLLTAVENAAMPLLLAGVARRDAEGRAAELLERVGLTARRTHRPDQLSGGERQRLAVARALAARPGLLLADEPTGNLDRATGATVLDLFQQVVAEDGIPMVLVTHDPLAAARATRRVALIDGRVDRDEPAPAGALP